jgi:hypothetical protein
LGLFVWQLGVMQDPPVVHADDVKRLAVVTGPGE